MKNYLFSICAIVLSILMGILALPHLPESVASHWGPDGNPDGYTSKYIGTFFMPFVISLVALLITVIPKIDPKKKNYKDFKKTYHIITDVTVAFLVVMHIVTLLFNLGYDIKMNFVVLLGVAFLFILTGNYLPKIKHNYFIGIRNPWTLASKEVWTKTHRFGGKLFVFSGLLMIALLFVNLSMIVTVLIPIIVISGGITVTSFVYYKKEQ